MSVFSTSSLIKTIFAFLPVILIKRVVHSLTYSSFHYQQLLLQYKIAYRDGTPKIPNGVNAKIKSCHPVECVQPHACVTQ